MIKKLHQHIISFRWVGLVTVLSVITISFQDRNSTMFGISLVILLPLYIFIALSNLPNLIPSSRALIAASFSALGGAVFSAIDDGFGAVASLIYRWITVIHLVLASVAIILIFASVIYALKKNKKRFVTSLLSFIILTACIGTSIMLPIMPPLAKFDFYWKLPSYKAVVELVRAGELVPNSLGWVDAPPQYGFITVHVYEHNDGEQSFFFRRSLPIQVYLYSETNQIPKTFECKEIEGEEFWFDCFDHG